MTRIISLIFLTFFTNLCYSQQNICADSSVRVKYIFGNYGATFYNNPDTIGENYFTGQFRDGIQSGIALLKTNWGDSIIWAKKILVNGFSLNSYRGPNGTIICTGSYGLANSSELLICKLDTNGNVLWINHYKLSLNHGNYIYGNIQTNNLAISPTSIYLNAKIGYSNNPSGYANIIAKLDLDGNILWSKDFNMKFPKYSAIIDAPIITNNKVLFLTSVINRQFSGPGYEMFNVLTGLNDLDGSLIFINSYKVIPDTLVKGISSQLFFNSQDYTFTLTGYLNIDLRGGYYFTSNIPFNAILDSNLNVKFSNYYYNNIIDNQNSFLNFNQFNQHVIAADQFGSSSIRYFISFDNKNKILRSRKFIAYSGAERNSTNIDDKQNVHLLFHYRQGVKLVFDYARVSNFSASGTPGCFGKDTNILTSHPFALVRENFAWDTIANNVLSSNAALYTVDTVTVTKELICKQVSYCNNLHINGPAVVCVNQHLRFTAIKNSECLKNIEWDIDTTIASVINREGDSAIIISFTQPVSGYIHAFLSNCIVKDSFLVKVKPFKQVHIINKDSILCGLKLITLNTTIGFRSYQWQDGRSTSTYTVNHSGFYKVIAYDSCGFQSSDSVTISMINNSLAVPVNQTICQNDTAFIDIPNDSINIAWMPTGYSMMNGHRLNLFPQQTTGYTIIAYRMTRCPVSYHTVVIVKFCPETIYIPNSFSPNMDGNNDIFKAIVSKPLRSFSLEIYNRFGQKIYRTNNQNSGWDGKFKGINQPVGIYIYQCLYNFGTKGGKRINGTITLIR